MLMPGRHYNADKYRFGFNGYEKDDEVKGAGNHYTTSYRQYDPRIARWFSIDPKATIFETPYSSMSNSPIWKIDALGDITYIYNLKGEYVTTINDNLETNEIVFMTQENADRVNNVNQGIKEGEQDLTNWWANKARQDLSTARLTEKTAKDMAKHWGRSPERGGVLFINKETQELEVFRCIPCEENSNTFDLSKLYAKAGNIKFGVFTDEINGDPFVLWHTHPETSFFGSFPSLPDGAFPTNDIFGAWGLQDVDIYQKYFKKEGTKSSLLEGVGLVLTNETLTIFPLGSIDNIYNSDRPFKSKFENDFEPSGIDRGTTGTDPIRQFGSFKTGN